MLTNIYANINSVNINNKFMNLKNLSNYSYQINFGNKNPNQIQNQDYNPRSKDGVSVYVYHKIPTKVLDTAEDLSNALKDGGLEVTVPRIVSGRKLTIREREAALKNPIMPLADYLGVLAHSMASNDKKLENKVWRYFETKPAMVEWLVSMKKNDNSARFSHKGIISIMKAYEINPDFTEELVEEKDDNGNYKYAASEISRIVKLTDFNPEIKEFAKQNSSELYFAKEYFTQRKVLVGHKMINKKSIPIYGNRYSEEEIRALLSAYCINKELTKKASSYRGNSGLEVEEFVKKVQKYPEFALKLLNDVYPNSALYGYGRMEGSNDSISKFRFNLAQITQIVESKDKYNDSFLNAVIDYANGNVSSIQTLKIIDYLKSAYKLNNSDFIDYTLDTFYRSKSDFQSALDIILKSDCKFSSVMLDILDDIKKLSDAEAWKYRQKLEKERAKLRNRDSSSISENIVICIIK